MSPNEILIMHVCITKAESRKRQHSSNNNGKINGAVQIISTNPLQVNYVHINNGQFINNNDTVLSEMRTEIRTIGSIFMTAHTLS